MIAAVHLFVSTFMIGLQFLHINRIACFFDTILYLMALDSCALLQMRSAYSRTKYV